MSHDIIDQCRAINLPPIVGDQYYLTFTKDGGPEFYGATRCANALDIINNCLRINGMDWAEILRRTRIMGNGPPSIALDIDPDGYGFSPYHRFSFECGTYIITGEGPVDFDEDMALSKKPVVPMDNLAFELQALEKIDTQPKSS
jgi:hypothetical protein